MHFPINMKEAIKGKLTIMWGQKAAPGIVNVKPNKIICYSPAHKKEKNVPITLIFNKSAVIL